MSKPKHRRVDKGVNLRGSKLSNADIPKPKTEIKFSNIPITLRDIFDENTDNEISLNA